jgi:hypothetical protein
MQIANEEHALIPGIDTNVLNVSGTEILQGSSDIEGEGSFLIKDNTSTYFYNWRLDSKGILNLDKYNSGSNWDQVISISGTNVGFGYNAPKGNFHIGNGATYSYINAGSSSFTVSSDKNIKTDIKDFYYNLTNFKDVPIKEFKFKSEFVEKEEDAQKTHRGMIAQDFGKAFFNSPNQKEIDMNDVSFILWQKVQELEKRIELLESSYAL